MPELGFTLSQPLRAGPSAPNFIKTIFHPIFLFLSENLDRYYEGDGSSVTSASTTCSSLGF
jgi:hypothetical protein